MIKRFWGLFFVAAFALIGFAFVGSNDVSANIQLTEEQQHIRNLIGHYSEAEQARIINVVAEKNMEWAIIIEVITNEIYSNPNRSPYASPDTMIFMQIPCPDVVERLVTGLEKDGTPVVFDPL